MPPSGGSSGGGLSTVNQTTQVKQDPWKPLQPYLKDVMSEAQRLYYGLNPMPYADWQAGGTMGGGQTAGGTGAPSQWTRQGTQWTDQYGNTASGTPGQSTSYPYGSGGSVVNIPRRPSGATAPSQIYYGPNRQSATTGGAGPFSSQSGYVPDPNAPPQYFPGSTVTPFSGETEEALAAQALRARQGSPLLEQAQGEVGKTLSGDYLMAGNPYFQEMMGAIDRSIRPAIDARFSGAGRYGSPAYAETTGRALADAGSNLAWQNYQAERQRQQQAAAMAPGLAAQDYADIGALRDVGAQREALSQAQLADEVSRWNFNQNREQNRLMQYAGLLQGIPVSQQQSTVQGIPYQPGNSMLGLLGAGSTGLGLANQLGLFGGGTAGLSSLFGSGAAASAMPIFGGESALAMLPFML